MKRVIFLVLLLVLTLGLTLPIAPVMAVGGVIEKEPQYVLAAHAVVQRDGFGGIQEETAWADCDNSQHFPGNNWAMWFTYPGNAERYDGSYRWGIYPGNNLGSYIGWVYVRVEGNVLHIWYDTTESDWYITETHVAVAYPDFNEYPDWYDQWNVLPHTKKGNPKVGKFTDLSDEKTGQTFDPADHIQVVDYYLGIP